jgi:two-component system, OmpR family, response regulator
MPQSSKPIGWRVMVDEGKAGTKAKRALQVLVVDDNRDAADSLAILLKLWGYQVKVAYNGAAGLAAAVAHLPDCLVLDINMPYLDGCTLAQRVRQQPGLEKVKLVALSAYGNDEHLQRTKEAGFEFHLVKPANPSDLERILKMLDEVLKLATKTEELARQNVTLAGETKELLKEVKQDIKEVKEEVKELKEELHEVKDISKKASSEPKG